MSVDWRYVGQFLIGVVSGIGIIHVYNRKTGQYIICNRGSSKGDAPQWNLECPEEVKALFGDTPP